MIEAVGQEHLVTYFTAIDAALKPGGKAIVQVWQFSAVLAQHLQLLFLALLS